MGLRAVWTLVKRKIPIPRRESNPRTQNTDEGGSNKRIIKLYDEELCNLYFSPNIVRMINSSSMHEE
jgi:hypothetical protein